MKSRSGEKIKLTSIDELLGVVNEESAMEIDISKIHAFKDHPFKVLDDEKMTDLVESVKAKGVLTPVLLRPDGEDGYEMISGHRRMYAAVRAGLKTIPAIVRELSDDDAVIAMVDANIQREELRFGTEDIITTSFVNDGGTEGNIGGGEDTDEWGPETP